MPNYPSVTLYYPSLMGNTVTQIRVMVKPLCESQVQSLDLWMSTVSLYLLLTPSLSNFTWELNNTHKTIYTHLRSLCSTGLWSITHYWGNWDVTRVITLLGLLTPKNGVMKTSNFQPRMIERNKREDSH